MPERTGPGLPEWEEAGRFAVPTLEEWRAEAVAALKGGEWDKKLLTRLAEGIDLRSLYTEADTAGLPFVDSFPGGSPFVRGTRALGHRLDPGDRPGASLPPARRVPVRAGR